MDMTDVAGLAIFMGTFVTLSIFVCSSMERKLRKIDRVIQNIENDTRYVN
jgi:hypothetical protein